ncbi:MAG: putative sulfate exporter family transporter [Xanthomonadaceae bacterium]|nr:putative sulfate exporter family transporter [Xanthomonadaceae bacterium]
MILFRKSLFVVIALLMLWPALSAVAGLAAGIAFAWLLGNPFSRTSAALATFLLKTSVVGLGFGLPIERIVQTGLPGLWVTGLGVTTVLGLGLALGCLLRVPADTRMLIGSGTAICGGSAIAAVAPLIRARPEALSVALACVFVLNATALLVFPWVGQWLSLTQLEFAVWAAIAIHDTSSVIGAASAYGTEALQQATVLKLARALWIVPLMIGLALLPVNRAVTGNRSIVGWPWFIGLFLVAAALRSVLPSLEPAFDALAAAARQLLVPTLFLIGAGLGLPLVRAIGLRSLLMAAALWVLVAAGTLLLVLGGGLAGLFSPG